MKHSNTHLKVGFGELNWCVYCVCVVGVGGVVVHGVMWGCWGGMGHRLINRMCWISYQGFIHDHPWQ